ncbi:MAG: polysaccharide biosynthesis protein, partial [Candidatus Latescibacterota bacterium]
RPNLVCHAAAYKHVPLMEENFEESVTNNVAGTRTIANIAHLCQTDIFVMMSTDKAVNPTSTMGLTKRIAEIYIQNLNGESKTRFMTVRFGNVFDSTGNVIQVFKQQIRQGGPVTVTHPEMLRNFMTISDAVKLVLEAAFFGKGGEIFGLDMGKPVKILDVAKSMIRIAGYEPGKDIEIVFTGMRPGEKLVEEHSYSGEDMIETPHPKIFVRKSRRSDWDTVRGKVDGIVDSIYRFDRETVIEDFIMDLVPEYQHEKPYTAEERYKRVVSN